MKSTDSASALSVPLSPPWSKDNPCSTHPSLAAGSGSARLQRSKAQSLRPPCASKSGEEVGAYFCCGFPRTVSEI